jgi:hypothetical protein
MDLEEIRYVFVEWIYLALKISTSEWQLLVNTEMRGLRFSPL